MRYVWGGKKITKIMFLIYLKISKVPGQEKDIRRTRALPGIIIYQQQKSIISAFKVIFAHWGGHPHSTDIPVAQKMSCQNIFISFPDFISYYKLSKDILKAFLRKIVCYNFLILREFLLVKNP